MPRFYMHLRDGTDELLDPDGVNYASVDDLRTAVLAIVRNLIGADVVEGVIDLRFRLNAEDQEGTIIHSLPFANAFTIIPA